VIVTLLSLSTLLNYVDRQTLALLAKPIQSALHMDDKGYAFVVTAFMLAYMGGNFIASWLIDRFGAQKTLAILVIWWSVAGIVSGFVQNEQQMAAARFALGLAEVGNWVAAISLVNLFFPVHQRALAVGLYTGTALLGAAISPPLVTWLNEIMGWRSSFILTGLVGLTWSALWLIYNRKLPEAALAGLSPTDKVEPEGELDTWWQALTSRRVWGVALVIMLTWPVWYFYLNWFPKYLTDERGLSTMEMGRQAWAVYLAAAAGSITGGAIPGLLGRLNIPPIRAKLYILAAVCLLAPIGLLNCLEPPVWVSLLVGGLVAFIHMYWQINVTALGGDLFTRSSYGRAFAISGLTSGIGGMASTWAIGQLVDTVSYKPMFACMVVLYPIGLAVFMVLSGLNFTHTSKRVA